MASTSTKQDKRWYRVLQIIFRALSQILYCSKCPLPLHTVENTKFLSYQSLDVENFWDSFGYAAQVIWGDPVFGHLLLCNGQH